MIAIWIAFGVAFVVLVLVLDARSERRDEDASQRHDRLMREVRRPR